MGTYEGGLKDGLDGLENDVPTGTWRHLQIDPDPRQRVGSIVDNVVWLLERDAKRAVGKTLRTIAEEKHDWTSIARQLTRAAMRFATAGRLTPEKPARLG